MSDPFVNVLRTEPGTPERRAELDVIAARQDRYVRLRHRWDRDPFTGRVLDLWVELPASLAEGVLTCIAVTLAEPLRKAFTEHADAHGCGCPRRDCREMAHALTFPTSLDGRNVTLRPGHDYGGIAHCPVGDHLFRLQPEGDQVILG